MNIFDMLKCQQFYLVTKYLSNLMIDSFIKRINCTLLLKFYPGAIKTIAGSGAAAEYVIMRKKYSDMRSVTRAGVIEGAGAAVDPVEFEGLFDDAEAFSKMLLVIFEYS